MAAGQLEPRNHLDHAVEETSLLVLAVVMNPLEGAVASAVRTKVLFAGVLLVESLLAVH